jgi:endonuclease III
VVVSERKRASAIAKRLEETYPDASCSLDFKNPYQLLVATVLSAQCTDERVNMVTPALFRLCPAPAALAALSQEELEGIIRSTGFYRNKAKSLRGACRMIVERFGGKVPDRMDALVTLPGVARKTANVVLGNAFGKSEGVVVDTHVHRLAGRLGLSAEREPEKVERDLMGLFPKEAWVALSHRLIHHGRKVCAARKPACGTCSLSDLCPKQGVQGAER